MLGSVGNGRYELREVLGSGGMGTVYLALDTQLGQSLALKRLHPHLTGDQGLRRRLHSEVVCSRRIAHSSVLRVFEAHEEPGEAYLTMEYFASRDLERYLQGSKPLVSKRVSELAAPVCEALEAAHRQGIVHRDLKPQNVLIGESGGVKVCDFGLARVDGLLGGATGSVFVGTPEYAAPELLAGSLFDHRADLFALGLLLYRMAAGPLPAGEASMAALLRASEATGSRLAKAPFDGVPIWLRQVILRLTEVRAEARYASAQEVRDALAAENADPYGLAGDLVLEACSSCGAARVPGERRCPLCSQEFVEVRQTGQGQWLVMAEKQRSLWRVLLEQRSTTLNYQEQARLLGQLRGMVRNPAVLDFSQIDEALNPKKVRSFSRAYVLFDGLDEEDARAIGRHLSAAGVRVRAQRTNLWTRFRARFGGAAAFGASALIAGLTLVAVQFDMAFVGMVATAVGAGLYQTLKLGNLAPWLKLKPLQLPAGSVRAEVAGLIEAARGVQSERLKRVVLEVGAYGDEAARRMEASDAVARAALGAAPEKLQAVLLAAGEVAAKAASLESSLTGTAIAALERERQELEEARRLGVEPQVPPEREAGLQADLARAEGLEQEFFRQYARLTRLSGQLRQLCRDLASTPAEGQQEQPSDHWLRLASAELDSIRDAPLTGTEGEA